MKFVWASNKIIRDKIITCLNVKYSRGNFSFMGIIFSIFLDMKAYNADYDVIPVCSYNDSSCSFYYKASGSLFKDTEFEISIIALYRLNI